MTAPPAQAIAPLRERLAQLRAELARLPAYPEAPERYLSTHQQLVASIHETEALIKRLENNNAPRHP